MKMAMNVLSRSRILPVVTLLGWVSSACGDRCLALDYAPPSARIELRDAATGEAICSASDFVVTTSLGSPIAHEDTCEWWLPQWLARQDAGANATESTVTLMVAGYLPAPVVFEVRRDTCGEAQRPPLQLLSLEPE